QAGLREIGALEVHAREVEAGKILPGEVRGVCGACAGERCQDLVAGEPDLRARAVGGGARRHDGEDHPRQGPGWADHGLLFLLCRSESRCGRPGLSQPSLRAFTYRYTSWMAAESSSTFHAGMPFAGRPFQAVLTKLSRGKFAPVGLTAQRKSGAVGRMGRIASSP